MTIRHLSQPIAGLLRNYPVGTLDFVLDDKGNALSDKEARLRLNNMLEQGQKVIPTTSECVGFDFVTGCPGHEELVGSDLTRAMLKRGDALVIVRVSDESDEMALKHDCQYWVARDIGFETGKFVVNHDFNELWPYAVAINPKTGEPFTAHEVGL